MTINITAGNAPVDAPVDAHAEYEGRRFDIEAAVAARAANKNLTPYDTGELLEPSLWVKDGITGNENPRKAEASDYGKVEFEDEYGAPMFLAFGHPSAIDPDTTVIQIDTLAGNKFTVMLNDDVLFSGDIEGETPTVALLKKYDETEAAWAALHDDDEPRSSNEYQDHDDSLMNLLHDLVIVLRATTSE